MFNNLITLSRILDVLNSPLLLFLMDFSMFCNFFPRGFLCIEGNLSIEKKYWPFHLIFPFHLKYKFIKYVWDMFNLDRFCIQEIIFKTCSYCFFPCRIAGLSETQNMNKSPFNCWPPCILNNIWLIWELGNILHIDFHR